MVLLLPSRDVKSMSTYQNHLVVAHGEIKNRVHSFIKQPLFQLSFEHYNQSLLLYSNFNFQIFVSSLRKKKKKKEEAKTGVFSGGFGFGGHRCCNSFSQMALVKRKRESSPSPSSSSTRQPKSAAFLSFRGEDTCTNFSDHLYVCFEMKGDYYF
ncbi:uncharacterized protein LOC115961066 [Quercus lobata]|uniref:uncharacterized protein LOC115961066 n=1 Tax=Quercus lobata TaxID=97700 RepID=UPI0012441977|nr:uncharacterized protein LOC115961066 [Quercus lobata]